MFTQCSNCNTVFELSAEVLRAAGGQVRCGRCGEIFNALARLAEDAGAFDIGESVYEMEERADSILESVPPPPVPPASPEDEAGDADEYGGTEIAQLQVLDFSQENFVEESLEDAMPETESYSAAALEFTLPPGELDRIFVESSVGIMPPFSSLESLESLEPPDLEPPEPSEPLGPLEPAKPLEPPQPLAALAPPAAKQPAPKVTAVIPVEDDGPLPDIEIISDERLAAVASGLSPHAEPGSSSKSFALWLSAAIAAALLLVAQVAHRNRDFFSTHGKPDLAAFQLRQWGVTGDAAGDSTLRVRASILNATTRMQPFPLLRVTLANRYGTRIGTRDFAPSEYVGKPIARALSPGEKVDAVLNILDPGQEAEGFEIDVCLPGEDKKIVCANDTAPSQARQ